METEIGRVLSGAIDDFLKSIPPDVRYYGMGGDVAIPSPDEMALLHTFESSAPRSRDDLDPLAHRLNLHQADILTAFSVRMAILAVRTNIIQTLRAGTFGLVVDDNLVDWRDVLVVLSVIEDSALRLGCDLKSVIGDAIKVASVRRRAIICDDYMSRNPEMRGIRVMGIEALGHHATFTYKSRPW